MRSSPQAKNPAFLAFRDKMLEVRKSCESAGESMFMGIPDRWFEKPGPKYRCHNGHVSTAILKSEAAGGDCCLACQEFVLMTAPEDEDYRPF